MRKNDVRSQVADHHLFAGLDRDQIQQFLDATSGVEEAEAGTVLMKEGADAEAIVMLLTGEVDIVKRLAHGAEHHLATERSFAVIGEAALLEKTPRLATVRAKTPIRFVRITREQFQEQLDGGSVAARSLLGTIAITLHRRLREAVGSLAESLDLQHEQEQEQEQEQRPRLDLSNLRSKYQRHMSQAF